MLGVWKHLRFPVLRQTEVFPRVQYKIVIVTHSGVVHLRSFSLINDPCILIV